MVRTECLRIHAGCYFPERPSLTHELLARAAEAEFLADIDELNAPVDPRSRVRRVAQLLLTHADRIERGRIDPERIDQGLADGFGAALTKAHIIRAATDRIGMADHQKTITEQQRMMQRIGDRAHGPV